MYFCYLFELHPKSSYDTRVKYELMDGGLTTIHTHYYLTPDATSQEEEENFYPFHEFIEESWGGGYEYCKFVGVFGYYGNYEYLLYVVLPLFIFLAVWVYRTFISPVPYKNIQQKPINETPKIISRDTPKPKEKLEITDARILLIIFLSMLLVGILNAC